MSTRAWRRILVIGLALLGAAWAVGGVPAPRVDAAFEAFWAASDSDAAAEAALAVVRSGVSFDEAVSRLRRGRAYSASVAKGVVKLARKAEGLDFPYTLDVPHTYDPATRYQVRVQLHGGVGRPAPVLRGDGSVGALAGREQIYVLPQSWSEAMWWAPPQLDNLRAILDQVKRTYNVDENRVALAGISDGGTAAYYFAMRDTTPYASFLPLIGFIMVLRGSDVGVEGALFPNNMRNKPFFVVNTGKDRLYPTERIEPYLHPLMAGGLSAAYHPQPEGGHNTEWWPHVKPQFESFVADHPREPHPATITWQTDAVTSRNRAHWLVIDALTDSPDAREPLPDLNLLTGGPSPQFGVRTHGMRVTYVAPASNAAQIGLRAGDVVTAVNRRVLPIALDLNEVLDAHQPGTALTLAVARRSGSATLSGTYRPVMGPRITELFPTSRPTGRVDLVREGNTIRATTRGVAAFTLLLSPDVLDFSRPVTVIVDDVRVHEARPSPRLETLLKWAARDNDRTMLYGAELTVRPRR